MSSRVSHIMTLFRLSSDDELDYGLNRSSLEEDLDRIFQPDWIQNYSQTLQTTKSISKDVLKAWAEVTPKHKKEYAKYLLFETSLPAPEDAEGVPLHLEYLKHRSNTNIWKPLSSNERTCWI